MNLKDLQRVARRQGWRVVQTRRGGHLKWYSPEGTMVVTESTPSDYRSIRNTRANLRRAGLVLPRKDGRPA